MSPPPDRPRLYHITHVDNLTSILADGALCSDARRIADGKLNTNIGMTDIKQRRLRLPVTCHDGDRVGQYVPFYFAPRSVMLYIAHRGNHPEYTYREGQTPILHLEADLAAVIAWADANDARWAFTTSNAGAYYAVFHRDRAKLEEIDWAAVASRDFRSPAVKEAKQAEFLVRDMFPWTLVSAIGVINTQMQARVAAILQGAAHQPAVMVQPGWYF